jgi:hypothetical protein
MTLRATLTPFDFHILNLTKSNSIPSKTQKLENNKPIIHNRSFLLFISSAVNRKTMKFLFTALSVLAMMASTASAESTLEEKWEIGEVPEFVYDSLDISLTFDITDFIIPGQAQYSLYTAGCKEEGTLLGANDGLVDNGLDDTGNTVRNDESVTPISLSQSATVKVSVDPTTIVNSDLYTEDDTVGAVTAQIQFCIRFGLFTDGGNTEVEVNFLETVVTLDVDLSDGFQIASIAVAPKDKLVRTAAQAYQVEGYICTEEEILGDLSTVRNQGAQIRVCVRPDEDARADGIYMRAIDSFTWTHDSPAPISQVAIENRLEASNTLTSLYCTPGELVCHFVSILFASFYATPGAVSGNGIASMQFGGDNTYIDMADNEYQKDKTTNQKLTSFTKRRNLRNLQEGEDAATSEFDLSFEVDQGDLTFSDSTSDASSPVGTLAMSMIAAAGVLVML